MKLCCAEKRCALRGSPPARGAWIETRELQPGEERPPSPPARGAWIETLLIALAVVAAVVAPRAGGVD